MTTGKDFDAVFERLRGILAAHAEGMDVVHDEPGNYYLNSRHVRDDGYVFMFGAVQTKARYVSYHLMPLSEEPSLGDSMSEGLGKRKQGKSCLNFTKVDDELFTELETVTAQAAEIARRSAS